MMSGNAPLLPDLLFATLIRKIGFRNQARSAYHGTAG